MVGDEVKVKPCAGTAEVVYTSGCVILSCVYGPCRRRCSDLTSSFLLAYDFTHTGHPIFKSLLTSMSSAGRIAVLLVHSGGQLYVCGVCSATEVRRDVNEPLPMKPF